MGPARSIRSGVRRDHRAALADAERRRERAVRVGLAPADGGDELLQLLHHPLQPRCPVVLAVAAIWALTCGRDATREPRWLAVALSCVTTYMIITGIVYNLLLRGIELPQGSTVPWSNEV